MSPKGSQDIPESRYWVDPCLRASHSSMAPPKSVTTLALGLHPGVPLSPWLHQAPLLCRG